jgi:2-methylaconitate cis-trans-isomerase PrpF
MTFYSVNTDRLIDSTFSVINHLPLETGSLSLDGVHPTSSPIRLDFLNPSGSMTGRLLPTSVPIQTITIPSSTILPIPGIGGANVPNDKSYTISCVDAANPFIFVLASEFGLTGHETSKEIESITEELMRVREHAAVLMGLASSPEQARKVQGTPKIALVGIPSTYKTSSGRLVEEGEYDVWIRAFSMGKPHPAIQMTGAVCVGAASSIPGTIINRIVEQTRQNRGDMVTGETAAVVIGHASGTMSVDGECQVVDGETIVKSGSVYRTARRLMEGSALYLA